MSRADFAKVHVIPTRAQQLLQQHNTRLRGCGICPTANHCWIASENELLIWNYTQPADPRSKVLRVLGGSDQTLFVEIIPYPPSNTISVLACTSSGQLYCWLDATYLSKPQVLQLFNSSAEPGRLVTSFTAVRVGQGASQAYIALASTSDESGAVYLIQGSRSGNFAKQLPTNLDGAASSASVVGLLGNALKSACQFAYAELVDPVYKAQRRGPANQPVINCKVVPHEMNKWKAYLLTYATIDCWLITIGDASSEELLWSFNLLPVIQGHLKNQQVDILNFDISTRSQMAYVWSAHKPQDSPAVKHALHTLPLDNQGVPWPLHSHLLQDEEFDSISMNDDDDLGHWTVLADGAHGRCLLMYPKGQVAEWASSSGSVKVLSQDTDNLAIALQPPARTQLRPAISAGSSGVADVHQGSVPWLLLSAAYGLLELASPHDAPYRGSRAQEVLTPEMEQAALTALDSALLGRVPMGLRRRLESLGVFEHPRNVQVLSRCSSTLLNKLPKQWSASGAELTAVGGSIVTTLKAKQDTHSWLIYCLTKESCLTLIHDLSPSVLRTIFENAEKLEATVAVAQLLWPTMDEEFSDVTCSKPPPFMLQIAEQAGQLIKSSKAGQGAQGLGDSFSSSWVAERSKQLRNWEVTFSYASAAPEALFQAIEQLATEVKQRLQDDVDISSALEQLQCAANIMEKIATGADEARTAIQRIYVLELQVRSTSQRPDWVYGSRCRAALAACAAACRLLKRYAISAADQRERVALTQHFTEKLLNSYAAALSFSLVGAEEAPAEALFGEYREACDVCLASLMEDVLTQLQGPQRDEALADEGLVWVVEALAAAHHAHAQLFQLCETLSSIDPDTFSPKLLHHMRALGHQPGGPPRSTFSRYVFQQLYQTGQWARLLELPPTYWMELKEFLALHPHLLQALLVQMGDFPAAAATMLEEGYQAQDPKVRRHMLCLARMACRACNPTTPADPSIRQKAAAQLQLLDVQRCLGLEEQAAMPSMVLAAAALQAREQDKEGAQHGQEGSLGKGQQGLLALRALLAAGPGSKEDARSLWRAAWEAVVDATDWQEMEAVRSTGGNWKTACEASPLFAAFASCKRSHLLGFGSEVVDLGETRELTSWIKEWSSNQPVKERHLLDTFEHALQIA